MKTKYCDMGSSLDDSNIGGYDNEGYPIHEDDICPRCFGEGKVYHHTKQNPNQEATCSSCEGVGFATDNFVDVQHDSLGGIRFHEGDGIFLLTGDRRDDDTGIVIKAFKNGALKIAWDSSEETIERPYKRGIVLDIFPVGSSNLETRRAALIAAQDRNYGRAT